MMRFASHPAPVRQISACSVTHGYVSDAAAGGSAVLIDIGPVTYTELRTAEIRAPYLWRGGGRGWLCKVEHSDGSWSVATCATEVHF
jgi:hypothetical protein